jgi:hypothetical protein
LAHCAPRAPAPTSKELSQQVEFRLQHCRALSQTFDCTEMAFREHAMMVFLIQLTKHQGIVPMTRDYIT